MHPKSRLGGIGVRRNGRYGQIPDQPHSSTNQVARLYQLSDNQVKDYAIEGIKSTEEE